MLGFWALRLPANASFHLGESRHNYGAVIQRREIALYHNEEVPFFEGLCCASDRQTVLPGGLFPFPCWGILSLVGYKMITVELLSSWIYVGPFLKAYFSFFCRSGNPVLGHRERRVHFSRYYRILPHPPQANFPLSSTPQEKELRWPELERGRGRSKAGWREKKASN